MPFIHIKSLPLAYPVEMDAVVTSIARRFSEETHIELKHIHVTWEFIQSGLYARGDETPTLQPTEGVPVIVDLLIPDSNTDKDIHHMMETIASAIAGSSGISRENIFINCRMAQSGRVFDAGDIVHW